MRVCLDTNVLVSAVATRGLCADLLQVVLADHRLVLGETVLAELQRVLRRKLHVPTTTIQELDTFLRRHADVVPDAAPLHVLLRDDSDLPVLAEAVAAAADVLVTGDADLLIAANKSPVASLAPRAFWELLRRGATARAAATPGKE